MVTTLAQTIMGRTTPEKAWLSVGSYSAAEVDPHVLTTGLSVNYIPCPLKANLSLKAVKIIHLHEYHRYSIPSEKACYNPLVMSAMK